MQLRHLLVTVSIVGALSACSVYAKNSVSKDFVHQASVANEFEIETSKLALEKSQNSDVKKVANHIIADHTKTGKTLQAILQSSHSDITPDSDLDADHQSLYDKLSDASADAFDSEYVEMQKTAHKDAIRLFTRYSQSGDDPALKAFAAKTLPALQNHLKHVNQLTLSK